MEKSQILGPAIIATAVIEAIQLGDWLIVDKLRLDQQGTLALLLGWVVYVLVLLLLVSVPLAVRYVRQRDDAR